MTETRSLREKVEAFLVARYGKPDVTHAEVRAYAYSEVLTAIEGFTDAERSPSPAALSTSENLKEMQRLSGLIEVWNGDLSEMVILQTAMTMTARQYLRELAVERGTAPPEKDAL
jgi:hypothetical protein